MREVGVHDAAAGSGLVLGIDAQGVDDGLEAILGGTELGASRVDHVQHLVDVFDGGPGAILGFQLARAFVGRSVQSGSDNVRDVLFVIHVFQRNLDLVGIAVACTDVEGQVCSLGAKQFLLVELGAAERTLDLGCKFQILGIEGETIAFAVGGVGSLNGQLAHPLAHVADLGQGAFCGLGQRDGVVGVADGDVHAAHLGVHALGDGQAGGIVLGTVDAQAGGQALDRLREHALRGRQVALGIEGHQVGVDDLGHGGLRYEGGE